ncbi:MAG: A/G-specific adenine glycosylase, partial [Mesorhizobium sp.]
MAPHDQTRKAASGESSEALSGGVASRLLAWYDAHHRDLPWRVAPGALAGGARPDPYRVWLS